MNEEQSVSPSTVSKGNKSLICIHSFSWNNKKESVTNDIKLVRDKQKKLTFEEGMNNSNKKCKIGENNDIQYTISTVEPESQAYRSP